MDHYIVTDKKFHLYVGARFWEVSRLMKAINICRGANITITAEREGVFGILNDIAVEDIVNESHRFPANKTMVSSANPAVDKALARVFRCLAISHEGDRNTGAADSVTRSQNMRAAVSAYTFALTNLRTVIAAHMLDRETFEDLGYCQWVNVTEAQARRVRAERNYNNTTDNMKARIDVFQDGSYGSGTLRGGVYTNAGGLKIASSSSEHYQDTDETLMPTIPQLPLGSLTQAKTSLQPGSPRQDLINSLNRAGSKETVLVSSKSGSAAVGETGKAKTTS